MAKKDFYEILGISKTATQDEIKKAFRKLAHQHHPDKGGGNEEKFKEANEAYQVLSDAQKRQQYDQFGHAFEGGGAGAQGFNWSDMAGGGSPFGSGFRTNVNFEDLGDIFGDMFGFGGGGGGRRAAATREGRDLEIPVAIEFMDAVRGVSKRITLEKQTVCDKCHGAGSEKKGGSKTCATCGGSGVVEQAQRTILGTFAARTVCPQCRGEGTVVKDPCSRCKGEGRMVAEETIEINIPAGVSDGTTLRLSGKGEAGVRGAGSGDLFVTVSVTRDHRFARKGDDIHTDADVPLTTAVLGGSIQVETVDGRVETEIAAGTQPGTVVRLKGKGMPHVGGSGRGDQYVAVKIIIPTHLSKKEKELYEQLSK
jgi:molecular chaperone DnaJ